MYKADRLYSVKNQITGKLDWFFQAREGDFGPYESKDDASLMLKEFIEECVEQGLTGGRKEDAPTGPKVAAKIDINQPRKVIKKYLGKRKWF